MKLRKSYRGFVLWLVGYCVLLLSLSFLPAEDGGLVCRLICGITAVGMVVLTWMIYRTEYVYWYNGTSYEEAEAAGSARRKAFALAHLKRFGCCALGCLLFSLLAQALNWPFWLDLVVVGLALVAAAVSTMNIKL